MKVTYDAEVDAAYIYLTDSLSEIETREVDSGINFDFDKDHRLAGIEVLDASRRLDLEYLRSVIEEAGSQLRGWPRLKRELSHLKERNLPVETETRRVKNSIEEIGSDYVVLLSAESKSGKTRTIFSKDLDNPDLEYHRKAKRARIVLALWNLGGYQHHL